MLAEKTYQWLFRCIAPQVGLIAIAFVLSGCASPKLDRREENVKKPGTLEGFDGNRVAVLLFDEADMETVRVIVGTATVSSSSVELEFEGQSQRLEFKGSPESLMAFESATLSELMPPAAFERISQLVQGIEYALPVVSTAKPATAVQLTSPFYGVALGPSGQVYLMMRRSR